MSSRNKKVTIANVPLNAVRDIEDPRIIGNTPMTVEFNQDTNSLDIIGDDGTQMGLSGPSSATIGTIDFTTINALPASANVTILFSGKIPANVVPQTIFIELVTPFVMGGGTPIGFDLDWEIVNTSDITVNLSAPLLWNTVNTSSAGTNISSKLEVHNFVGKIITQDITAKLNFYNTGTKDPISNPKALTAGRVNVKVGSNPVRTNSSN